MGKRKRPPGPPDWQIAPRVGIMGENLSLESDYFRDLAKWGGPCIVRCEDGAVVEDAVVKDAGLYALLIETAEGEEILFKHSIHSIRPMGEA